MSAVRLFDVEPDLTRYLSEEDRAAVRRLAIPVREIPAGPVGVRELLAPLQAFSALVLDGMILQSMRLGEHNGLRLIGPGDALSLTEAPASMLVLDWDCRATVPTRVAVLGREFMLAARRWPLLIAGLHTRVAEQSERLVTQLMICQLPRVDDRLLAMMWLLSESWGHVTASGTVLPLELTHSALGGLVGARRPTVTLALSELTERGAIVRQRSGWLLLEPPAAPKAATAEAVGEPVVLPRGHSPWLQGQPSDTEVSLQEDLARAELREEVHRLRHEHDRRRLELQASLDEMITSRKAIVDRRRQLRPEPSPAPKTRRRGAPSS